MSLIFDQVIVRLSRCDCAKCGLTFGVSDEFKSQRRDDHAMFYCPNGHTNYYPYKSKAERIQVELENERAARRKDIEAKQAAFSRALNAERERDHHWTERKKTNTRLRHLKERVKHGVCPCCHRTFADVARHMETKHPGFAKPENNP